MGLKSPNYIPLATIEETPIKHHWDDWDPYRALGQQDPDSKRQLALLSDRAVMAYSIGCAEWVTYRFGTLSVDQRPYDFLEASWAFVMDGNVAVPPESQAEEWKGPIRGPIDLALMTILNTIYATEDETGNIQGAFAELIALHVLDDPKQFLGWRERVLARLQRYYPRIGSAQWGRPVPREALDPSVELTPQLEPQLIRAFLANLDYESNKFLRSLETTGDR